MKYSDGFPLAHKATEHTLIQACSRESLGARKASSYFDITSLTSKAMSSPASLTRKRKTAKHAQGLGFRV